MKKNVLILGAGLSGLSCAYFLKNHKFHPEVFEEQPHHGGLCRSRVINGFTFDCSGHLLHFRNKRCLRFVKNLLAGNIAKHTRSSFIHFNNNYIPYPFQVNFNLLPELVSRSCLLDFIHAQMNGKRRGGKMNLFMWLKDHFGEGIVRSFMLPYNHKFWKVPLNEIDSQWARRFIVMPPLKSVVDSYQGRNGRNLGYNANFWYPEHGGIGELPDAFARRLDCVHTNFKAIKIDLQKKQVTFNNGVKKKFDLLVSTIPLPELVSMVPGVPENILSSVKKLRWLSVFTVNLGLKNRLEQGRHWIYFSQKNIPFFRVGFYDNFSSSLVPSGKGSLYAEVSYINKSLTDKKSMINLVKDNLAKVFNISDPGFFLSQLACNIEYAYPIPDFSYYHSRERIIKYLLARKLFPAADSVPGATCLWRT